MLNVAINGWGRIGRATLKILENHPLLDLVAINDLIPADNLGYLLKFDSVYGRWHTDVIAQDGRLRRNLYSSETAAWLSNAVALPMAQLGSARHSQSNSEGCFMFVPRN